MSNIIADGTYTIINAYHGTDALPQAGAATDGVRVLDKIDGSPPVTAQQWLVTWHRTKRAYTIQNVATDMYASSVQISAPYYRNPTVQMNGNPDYWTFSEGDDRNTLIIKSSRGTVWAAYTGDTNGAIILGSNTGSSSNEWLLGRL